MNLEEIKQYVEDQFPTTLPDFERLTNPLCPNRQKEVLQFVFSRTLDASTSEED